MARCSICGEEHPLATMVTAHKRPEELPDGAAGAFPDPSDWWLADAEERSAAHPRSYFIPPRERRYALKHGELVRLQFCYGPHADREREGHVERMWVEVVEQHAGGHVHGRLRNTPVRLAALGIGDLVAFEPRHVASIDYTDDELGYSQEPGRARRNRTQRRASAVFGVARQDRRADARTRPRGGPRHPSVTPDAPDCRHPDVEHVDGVSSPAARYYSASASPEPPSSSGKSLSLGRPSFIGSTVDS